MVFNLFFILLFTSNLSAMSSEKPKESPNYTLSAEFNEKSDLVIAGKIIKKEEIWDRRSNPLMGRPDILKEIIYIVKPETIYKGKLQQKGKPVTVSVKERKSLIAFRVLIAEEVGIFYLAGSKSPYELLHFQSTHRPKMVNMRDNKIKPQPVNKKYNSTIKEYYDPEKEYTDKQIGEMLEPPVRIASKYIFESVKLQNRAVNIIAIKYKMESTSLVTKISHQGPRPPRGGYKYWGVRGKIKSVWHIWQFGKLKKGDKLEDPKRFQK